MRKTGMKMAMMAAVMAVGLMTGCTEPVATTTEGEIGAAATESFNPDKEAGVTIEELREQLGAVPKVEGEVKLGAVAKSFDNEYWRT